MSAVKNALPTGLLILGAQKGVASSQGVEVPTEVQMEGALVGGMSAVAVDSTLRGQNQIVRGAAVGGLLSAGMYLWKGDDAWMLWFPTGLISYLASDWATSQMKV
jgi:hypothetical protein